MKDYREPKFGLLNYPSTLAMMNMNKRNDFPYSGIWVYTGYQGAGKTLHLIHTLKDIIAHYPKVKVISNINLYGIPYEPYRGINDFEKGNGKDGIIYVIDEIHTIYSSLESKNMSGSLLTVWSQNRKNRRLIMSTSQRWSRVAKPIREQASFNIETRSTIFKAIFLWRAIDATEYDDEGKLSLEAEKAAKWSFYIPKWSDMTSYDTLAVVRGGDFK